MYHETQIGEVQEAEATAKEAARQVGESLQQMEADSVDAHNRLNEEVQARKAITAEASAKAARLARLEGGALLWGFNALSALFLDSSFLSQAPIIKIQRHWDESRQGMWLRRVSFCNLIVRNALPTGEFEAMQEAIGTGSVDQAEMLGRLISRVASLEAAVAEAHCARRELHNQLVNLKGNVSASASPRGGGLHWSLSMRIFMSERSDEWLQRKPVLTSSEQSRAVVYRSKSAAQSPLVLGSTLRSP